MSSMRCIARLDTVCGHCRLFYSSVGRMLHLHMTMPGRTLWRHSQPLPPNQGEFRHMRLMAEGSELVACWHEHGREASLAFPCLPLSPAPTHPASPPVPLPMAMLDRAVRNPMLQPLPAHERESQAVFNAAAIELGGRVHFVCRAVGDHGLSTFGCAASSDGVNIDERGETPIYDAAAMPSAYGEAGPAEPYDYGSGPSHGGCEDPRLAREKRPVTPFNAKAMALFPERVDGKINRCASLEFGDGRWLNHDTATITPRTTYWDNRKFGIAAPPIDTPHGWLLLFLRVTKPDDIHKVEAMLLDRDDPCRVLADTGATLLEPETPEERVGQTPNVVFPCGGVIMGEDLYIYYGGADSVVCVASMPLVALYKRLGL